MPQLHEKCCFMLLHLLDNLSPAFNLLLTINAWHTGISATQTHLLLDKSEAYSGFGQDWSDLPNECALHISITSKGVATAVTQKLESFSLDAHKLTRDLPR